jgi:nucleotide-binding universal stress UspA family protein
MKRAGAVKKVSSRKRVGKKWLLAVDPFGDFDIAPIRDFIVPLAEASDAHVYAAYVLAPAALNWTGDFSGPWMKRYKPLASARLAEMFPSSVIEPTVIPCHSGGVRASVKAMVTFAQKVKAECIVISTHARSGLERWTMGSFAETLILASKIPVLVINPTHNLPHGLQRILVPTDLSKRSEKYALEVADWAKIFGAELIFFYKQPDPLDPIVQQGVYSLGGGWVSVQNYLEEEVGQMRKRLERLEATVKKKGVRARSLFDTSALSLIDSINQAAEEHEADLTTVLTESGPWTAALLGSVARGLVRTSPVPVLVKR